MNIEIMANVTLKAQVHTVDNLRELVGHLNKHGVSGEISIDLDKDNIWIDLSGFAAAPADWIECGDHIPPSNGWDVLVEMHKHPERDEPAMFDWPTKDRINRYGDDSRPE